MTPTPLDFQRENVANDVGAGLTMSMVAVPDSIASASLAGVNPAFAFNSMMVGMPIAELFTSSHFMNCSLTSAMMLAAGDTLAGMTGGDQAGTLITLTVPAGAFQLLLGVLKLGSLTCFISNAVMTGFFTLTTPYRSTETTTHVPSGFRSCRCTRCSRGRLPPSLLERQARHRQSGR